ncbi:hypothetical protein JB92DRAFT_2961433 [Gautieria morchelliformis]|nr:hypothetical protein JB92DRAFT_2961433 [Gautieria morchelliformis]
MLWQTYPSRAANRSPVDPDFTTHPQHSHPSALRKWQENEPRTVDALDLAVERARRRFGQGASYDFGMSAEELPMGWISNADERRQYRAIALQDIDDACAIYSRLSGSACILFSLHPECRPGDQLDAATLRKNLVIGVSDWFDHKLKTDNLVSKAIDDLGARFEWERRTVNTGYFKRFSHSHTRDRQSESPTIAPSRSSHQSRQPELQTITPGRSSHHSRQPELTTITPSRSSHQSLNAYPPMSSNFAGKGASHSYVPLNPQTPTRSFHESLNAYRTSQFIPAEAPSPSSSDEFYDAKTLAAMQEVDLGRIEALHANEMAVTSLVEFLETYRIYSSQKVLTNAVRWLQQAVQQASWTPDMFNHMERVLRIPSDKIDDLVRLTQTVIATDDAI